MNIENALRGRRALVTGSSSGIGFETAAMLAEAGVSHIVIGRNRHRGEAARQAIRDRAPNAEVAFVAADVSSPDGARSLIQSAARNLGGTIELLVNAAGGEYTPRLFHQTSAEEINGIIRNWLLSTLREQREELRDLKVEVAKLGSTLAELRARPADFRFAREKGGAEVVDLPGFLSRRTVN
jgi:NAD(P)-dependent dehydrogenase (short-subunit alcohol dehydrogenase family)